MKLPSFILRRLQRFAYRVALSRKPDVVIGDYYLSRWWLIPRNRFFNIYLHHFQKSDDERALHCHPWTNVSCLIEGRYIEHTIAAGGVNHRKVYEAGALKFRTGSYAHRIEMFPGETTWSLFITGPKYREWYFHCKSRLVHWRDFTAPGNVGQIGIGCGDD